MLNINDALRAQRSRDEYRRRQDREEQARLRSAAPAPASALIPLAVSTPQPPDRATSPPRSPYRAPYRLAPPQAASIPATPLPALLSLPPAIDQPVKINAEQGGSRRSVKLRKRKSKKRNMSKMKKRKNKTNKRK